MPVPSKAKLKLPPVETSEKKKGYTTYRIESSASQGLDKKKKKKNQKAAARQQNIHDREKPEQNPSASRRLRHQRVLSLFTSKRPLILPAQAQA